MDASENHPRCFHVWRGTVGGRYVLDERAASRTVDRPLQRVRLWARLGVPVVVGPAGYDPNQDHDGWVCETS